MSSKPIIVRLTKNKKQFEILTHHGAVDKWRDGKLGWAKVTVSDDVYKNVNKGDRYTNKDLEESFGTSIQEECLRIIARDGEIQLTTQDRKEKTEEKYKQIVNYIHKYYINPKTKQPHPVTHIQAALEQVNFKATFEDSIEKQVDLAMKKLIGVLICKKSVMEGTLIIPTQYISSCYNVINGLCDVQKENHTSNSCEMYISIIPGNFDTLTTKLNAITKGEFDFIDSEATVTPTATTTATATATTGNGNGRNADKKKIHKGRKYINVEEHY
jgi:ribosome maturation protein SDO1